MNIEVDIEQIKSSLKELETERDDIQLLCIKSELELSIENVLSELENKDKEIDRLKEELEYDHKEYRRMLRDTKSELETYKKIAKRLAKEILLQYPEMFNMVTVNNIEMVIDEARKEVEKDV